MPKILKLLLFNRNDKKDLLAPGCLTGCVIAENGWLSLDRGAVSLTVALLLCCCVAVLVCCVSLFCCCAGLLDCFAVIYVVDLCSEKRLTLTRSRCITNLLSTTLQWQATLLWTTYMHCYGLFCKHSCCRVHSVDYVAVNYKRLLLWTTLLWTMMQCQCDALQLIAVCSRSLKKVLYFIKLHSVSLHITVNYSVVESIPAWFVPNLAWDCIVAYLYTLHSGTIVYV